MGFVLQQSSTQKEWTLVQAGSLSLSSAECRYAIIQLEMLTITWTIEMPDVFSRVAAL